MAAEHRWGPSPPRLSNRAQFCAFRYGAVLDRFGYLVWKFNGGFWTPTHAPFNCMLTEGGEVDLDDYPVKGFGEIVANDMHHIRFRTAISAQYEKGRVFLRGVASGSGAGERGSEAPARRSGEFMHSLVSGRGGLAIHAPASDGSTEVIRDLTLPSISHLGKCRCRFGAPFSLPVSLLGSCR